MCDESGFGCTAMKQIVTQRTKSAFIVVFFLSVCKVTFTCLFSTCSTKQNPNDIICGGLYFLLSPKQFSFTLSCFSSPHSTWILKVNLHKRTEFQLPLICHGPLLYYLFRFFKAFYNVYYTSSPSHTVKFAIYCILLSVYSDFYVLSHTIIIT